MGNLFNQIIYEPIFNALIALYNVIPGNDFGLTIIVLTIIIRLIFLPLSLKAARAQRMISALQPKIRAIQEQYKNDKTAQAQATMALYREHKVNPAGGCLPLLIQLPILIALYRALVNGFKPESLTLLYGFVANPGVVNNIAFGFFDLSQPSHWLAIFTGIVQFIQSKVALSKQVKAPPGTKTGVFDPELMGKQMLYFFPVMIVVIGWNLPAGLVLYWAITTVFSILEQLYVNHQTKVVIWK